MGLMDGIATAAQLGIGMIDKQQDEEAQKQRDERLSDLALRREEAVAALRQRMAVEEENRKRDQSAADAQAINQDADNARLNRLTGLINQREGSNMTPEDAKVIADNPEAIKAYGLRDRTRAEEYDDKIAAAEKRGLIGHVKELRGQQDVELNREREDNRDATTNKRLDQQFKIQQDRLEAQKAHWRKLEQNAGGDPNTREAARLKLELIKKEQGWREELSKLSANDPKRAAMLQTGKDMGWVKSEPSEFDTEKVKTEKTNPDGTVTTTERTQKRNAGSASAQTEADAHTQARKVLSAGRASLDEVNRRLESAGFKPIDAAATPSGATKSLKELQRIAARPKGVSVAEANAAQAEIDYLAKNPDRMKAF